MKRSPAYKHGLSRLPLYSVWTSMIARCKPNNPIWIKRNYYDRGISVCDEWYDVNIFFNWAKENGYKKGLTIDRRDNDRGYCPENCRFVTMKLQAFNKNIPSKNPAIIGTVGYSIRKKRRGLCISIMEIAELINISPSKLSLFERNLDDLSPDIQSKIHKYLNQYNERSC